VKALSLNTFCDSAAAAAAELNQINCQFMKQSFINSMSSQCELLENVPHVIKALTPKIVVK